MPGKPEDPLHSQLVEGGANEEKQRNCAQSLEGPHHPHGGTQVFPEPQSHARHRQYSEDSGGDAQNHAEEEVELPQVAHDACQHHSSNEEKGPKEQEPTNSVPVSKPSHVRAHQTQDHPLEAEGEADRAVAPAEPRGGVAQMRHQGSSRESHRRGYEPHCRSDCHDDPSVMNLSS